MPDQDNLKKLQDALGITELNNDHTALKAKVTSLENRVIEIEQGTPSPPPDPPAEPPDPPAEPPDPPAEPPDPPTEPPDPPAEPPDPPTEPPDSSDKWMNSINSWRQLKEQNHPYWQFLANRTTHEARPEGEWGVQRAMAYAITKNPEYIASACGQLRWLRNQIKSGAQQIEKNSARHLMLGFAFVYWLAKDANIEPDRKMAVKELLDMYIDDIFNGTGTRVTDSDETLGHYLGLALYAEVTGNKQILNFPGNEKCPPVGGLTVTGDNSNTLRNAVSQFANRARGGEWIESGYYNLGTLQYLLVGTGLLKHITGKDHFPELTALFNDILTVQFISLTPDLKGAFDWADVQNPGGLNLYRRLAVLGPLTGLTLEGERAQKLFHIFFQQHNGQWINQYWPVFFNFAGTWTADVDSETNAHWANGVGIFYEKKSNELWVNAAFRRRWVDHESSACTNFALWQAGEWVIPYGRGYYEYPTVEQWYLNTFVPHGGVDTWQPDKKYSPARGMLIYEWIRCSWTRDVNFDGKTITVTDHVRSSDPRNWPEWTDEKRFHKIWRDLINQHNARHQWIINSPVKPDDQKLAWTTQGGKTVKILNVEGVTFDTQILSPGEIKKYGGSNITDTWQLRLIPKSIGGDFVMKVSVEIR